MHGGTIAVSSAGEGHGSTFTVRLPMFMAVDKVAEGPGPGLKYQVGGAASGGYEAKSDPALVQKGSDQGVSEGLGTTLSPADAVAGAGAAPSADTYNILVVDDSQLNRKVRRGPLWHRHGRGHTPALLSFPPLPPPLISNPFPRHRL